MSEALKFSTPDEPARGHAIRPFLTTEGCIPADFDTDQVVALCAELVRPEGTGRKHQARIRRERAQSKVHFIMPSGSVASDAQVSRFQPMARR